MRFPLRIVAEDISLDFLGKRYIAFAASIAMSIITLVLLFTQGLNLGIDFTGGVILEVRTKEAADVALFRKTLVENGYHGATIQNFGDNNEVMIRLHPKDGLDQQKSVEAIKTLLQNAVDPEIAFRKVDYVGPKVGSELIQNGFLALAFALVGMLAYVALRFSWEYGVCAVVALLHNAWITVGFYLVSRYEFDLYSIAAILTIIGYSINDTVVIFDRIRENLRKYKIKHLPELINRSLNETLSRTVMTVATTLIACTALVIFGGEVIRGFSMAMLFGIAFGTYCSNFIAAPLLIYTGLKQERIA